MPYEAQYKKDGTVIDYTPSVAVAAGEVVVFGTLIAIAPVAIAANEPGSLQIRGEFEVAKVEAQAWAIGDAIYFDESENNFTTTSTSNVLAGKVVAVAANPSTVGRIVLNQVT